PVDLAVLEALLDLAHLAGLVFDDEVGLRALGVAQERAHDVRHRLALLPAQVEDLDDRHQRAVGVVVVAEVVVAGELAAEDGVLLAQRRLHEGVADALAYGDATVLADVLGDGAAAAQIEEDVAAGVVAEQLAGDE